MTSLNEFGRWVRRMRRYTGTTLMEMAKTFAASPAKLCGLEVSREGKTFSERQKQLIEYYFRLVCEEKGLPYPTEHKLEMEEKKDKQFEAVKNLFENLWGRG